MSGLDNIIEQITDEKTIQRWKELAAKEIRAFSKRANPFHGLKVSNYYLYIDTKTRSYSIELQGVKPNAGVARGFSAPTGQRESSDPQKILFGDKWRTVFTKRKTGSLGIAKPLDVKYYGVNQKPRSFFGLSRKGKKEAFGVVDNDVVIPVYNNTGLVEFLTQDMQKELFAILQNAGYTAINGG